MHLSALILIFDQLFQQPTVSTRLNFVRAYHELVATEFVRNVCKHVKSDDSFKYL